MEEGERFFGLEHEGINVRKVYEAVYCLDSDNIRIYFLPDQTIGYGFTAIVLEFHSCAAEHNNDWWEDESLEVDVVVVARAAYDGVRHIWFGDEDGYLYYACPLTLAEIFVQISKLENGFCMGLWRGGK